MFLAPVVLLLVISAFVKGEVQFIGNLSVGINHSPKPLTTTSTTAPNLAVYILAALGQTASTASETNTTTTYNATTTTQWSTRSSAPHVVCYTMTDKCWTDVYYTAPEIASTGSGSAYATKCSNALSSYSSASSSWDGVHNYINNQTYTIPGQTWVTNTYYVNATTSCDGHARVTYSPAIATATSTTTLTTGKASLSVAHMSAGWEFPVSEISCSVNPSDCDGLWKAYSTHSSKWQFPANATSSSGVMYPTITASPAMPACVNSSQSSSGEAFSESFYGCGPCTIFGDVVQLFYFPEPTTVSRDMCATTPSAELSHYNVGVGEPYTGPGSKTWEGSGSPPESMAVDDHTFTSGTAYISIRSVWAEDRCSSVIGTKVSNAVLALPSSSLLSLRYSQNHFQYFMTTNTQTGYPFNFADLNTPIPYSAWNGQAMCDFPGAADYKCNVIYENKFNPQLAMPPGIRKLNPDWERCQMWYGGLYDPPYALRPGTAVATPTVPGATSAHSTAAPSSSIAATTPAPTAMADQNSDGSASETESAAQATQTAGQSSQTGGQNNGGAGQNTGAGSQSSQDGGQNNQGGGQSTGSGSEGGGQNNQGGGQNNQGGGQNNQGAGQSTGAASQDGQSTGAASQGSQDTQGAGQNTQTSGGGSGDTQNNDNNDASNAAGGGAANSANSQVVVFTAGSGTYTAVSTNNVIIYGSQTLTAGGSAATLDGGSVISAAPGGLVVDDAPVTVANSPSAIAAASTSATGAVITVSGQAQTIVQDGSAGGVDIGSTHLTAGGSAATLSNGQVISAASDGIAIGGSTVKFSTFAAPSVNRAIITADGTTLTASGTGNVATIGSATLTAGGAQQTLASGAVVSLGQSGVVLVDGTTAATLSAATAVAATASSGVVFTIHGTAITAYEASGSKNTATISGTVISLDGPAATLSNGEVISMGSNGIVIQGSSTTVAFSTHSSSKSRTGAMSNTAVLSSGAGAAQDTQTAASSTSATPTSAAVAVQISLRTSIFATVLSLLPLLFALYL